MLRRHYFLAAAAVLLVAMVAIGGWKVLSRTAATDGAGPASQSSSGRRGGAGATPVSVAVAQPRVFEDTIQVLGIAKGRQSVTLTAAGTQLVERVLFRDGQYVRRGAVLVELKNTEEDAAIAQAEARLTQARRAYDRYRILGEQGWASKAAVDQYEAAWRTAQADVAAARARRNDRIVRAPFAGVVGLSDVAPGALVNPGAPIVTLDDIAVVRVDFQTPERYLAQLREGQPLLATVDAFPGETLTGRIARLDTRVDERTRAITARAEFANADRRLKPGMMMRIGISRGQRTSVGVPESAVSVQGDGAFVYVLAQQGGKTVAEQRPVATGLRQQGLVEIREGLRAGDRVVADGLHKVQPGQQVRTAAAPGRPGR